MTRAPLPRNAELLAIEPDDVTRALGDRSAGLSSTICGSRSPEPRIQHFGEAGLRISEETSTSDVVCTLRDAMRSLGVEGATVWAGTSCVTITAAMDDARLGATAMLLMMLAAGDSSSADLPGIPFS